VIGSQSSGLVDSPRITPSQQNTSFGAGYKERTATMEAVEALEVQIAPIHHVERAGFRQQFVQNIHVMQFSVGNLNESRNGATQVQQRMHFHRAFCGLEPSPRKQGQAQVNGGRVESIDGAVEIESKRLLGIHRPCGCD